MSQYLDFDGLSLYDKNVKKRTSEGYYDKDEIDNLLAEIETNILWKDAVETYDDIATTYPYPQEGWTVNVLDSGNTYRYNGDEWAQISASVIPKATDTNDGLMPKEMYTKVNALGTASTKDYVSTLDTSTSLPTSSAVHAYVDDAITQLDEALSDILMTKVSIDDVGDASEKNYIDSIPDETEKIRVAGEWYSYEEEAMFYLQGTGVDNGIDLSFVEDVNNYTLHTNLINYSFSVSAKLHLTGTKTIDGVTTDIDAYYEDGDVLVRDNVPDEYLDGTDSASFEVSFPEYVAYDVDKVEFLIFPVLHDEGNNVDYNLIDSSIYESEVIIHQEYDVLAENHIVTAQYGMYSSSDLPTSTAVSNLVKTVTTALQDNLETQIAEVEAKIDDYTEATDDEIDALFSDTEESGDASEEDIEGLFSM